MRKRYLLSKEFRKRLIVVFIFVLCSSYTSISIKSGYPIGFGKKTAKNKIGQYTEEVYPKGRIDEIGFYNGWFYGKINEKENAFTIYYNPKEKRIVDAKRSDTLLEEENCAEVIKGLEEKHFNEDEKYSYIVLYIFWEAEAPNFPKRSLSIGYMNRALQEIPNEKTIKNRLFNIVEDSYSAFHSLEALSEIKLRYYYPRSGDPTEGDWIWAEIVLSLDGEPFTKEKLYNEEMKTLSG